jgi:transposase
VDWSASFAKCAAAVELGSIDDLGRVRPDLVSVKGLVRRAQELGGNEIHVVIESGATGWLRLFHAAGAIVHVVDAKQARRFAESLSSSGAKDDRRDAETLAELGRSRAHLLAAWEPEEPIRASMSSLANGHDQVSQDLVRQQNRLRAILREHMPLVDDVLPKIASRWVHRFLVAVPTPWHGKQLTRSAFDDLLARSRCRPAVREALWEALRRTDVPWMEEVVANAIALRVRQMLTSIESLIQQLREIDKALDELTADLGSRQLLESVDGIGLQQAVMMLMHGFGSATDHRDDAGIRMGASPVFRGSALTTSGKPKGSAHMRLAAPSRAKRGVYHLGRLATQNLAWASAMYADARRRGQSAATAFRRIARSLLRVLTAMLRDNVPYDDARYVAALKAKGVPWAASL